MKLIILAAIVAIGCNSGANKKKFHNSDYTRKRVNGVYKFYTRY